MDRKADTTNIVSVADALCISCVYIMEVGLPRGCTGRHSSIQAREVGNAVKKLAPRSLNSPTQAHRGHSTHIEQAMHMHYALAQWCCQQLQCAHAGRVSLMHGTWC
jgi:hypothetical protein